MEASYHILLFYLILEVIAHQHTLNYLNSLFTVIDHSTNLASPLLREVFLDPAFCSYNAIRIFWSKFILVHMQGFSQLALVERVFTP